MEEFISKLHDQYLKSLVARIETMEHAVKARNFTEAIRIGHQLKGSGASYGFPDVTELGRRIEAAGQEHQAMLLEALTVELKNLLSELQEKETAQR